MVLARRARRILLVATLFCLVLAALSWLPAVSGSRNLSISIASVEWLRSHGGNPIATQIENWYYQLNEPEKGGPALTSLPQVGVGTAGNGGEAEGSEAGPLSARRCEPADPPEAAGRGRLAESGRRGREASAGTSHHLPQRPRIPTVRRRRGLDRLLRTELEYVPGLAEPPEPLEDRGSGEVPSGKRKRLVATFNGGFPLETSNAGLIFRGKVKETMVNGIATVVRYRDGRTDIVKWSSGPGAPKDVWFAKQNLPPIIYEGKLNPNLSDGPEWGETVNNQTRVWRSGLGIDAHGNLMYAAANYQTVESLAKVLQRAGAVRAIELDINEDWTSFISYRHPGASEPSNLLPEMYRSPERYLVPDERDFFAIYLRPGQPW